MRCERGIDGVGVILRADSLHGGLALCRGCDETNCVIAKKFVDKLDESMNRFLTVEGRFVVGGS